MKKLIYIFAFSALLTLNSLAGAARTPSSFPYPDIPDSLRAPQDRADFLARHFWDNLNFDEIVPEEDGDFIEQNFVDYLSILPIASPEAVDEGAKILIKKAENNQNALKNLANLAEKYLFDVESPQFSDQLYEPFLNAILALNSIDEIHKLRYRAQLEAVAQNLPGSPAPDFSFVLPEGQKTSLYQIKHPDCLLVIFYDPVCEHCKEVINQIRNNPIISNQLENNQLNVLAVFSGEDEDEWRQNLSIIPSGWTVGMEDGTIQDDGTYIFRRMPTMYLIDNQNNVILKDPTPQTIIETLSIK